MNPDPELTVGPLGEVHVVILNTFPLCDRTGRGRPAAAINLLAGDGWLLMLPRSQECFEGISISAVGFGGTLYTRTRAQIEIIRRVGPLQALAAVGC